MSDERTKELLDKWAKDKKLGCWDNVRRNYIEQKISIGIYTLEDLAQFIRDETKKDCALISFKDCSERLKRLKVACLNNHQSGKKEATARIVEIIDNRIKELDKLRKNTKIPDISRAWCNERHAELIGILYEINKEISGEKVMEVSIQGKEKEGMSACGISLEEEFRKKEIRSEVRRVMK